MSEVQFLIIIPILQSMDGNIMLPMVAIMPTNHRHQITLKSYHFRGGVGEDCTLDGLGAVHLLRDMILAYSRPRPTPPVIGIVLGGPII